MYGTRDVDTFASKAPFLPSLASHGATCITERRDSCEGGSLTRARPRLRLRQHAAYVICLVLFGCGLDQVFTADLPPIGGPADATKVLASEDAGASGRASTPVTAADGGATPFAGLLDALQGTWLTRNAVGNCIAVQEYLHFMPDGLGDAIRVDNDACEPEARGTFHTPITYSLEGRTLTVRSAETMERYDVGTSRSYGRRWLSHQVLLPVDSRRWRATYRREWLDPNGLVVWAERSVDLVLAEPLPRSGAGTTRADLDYVIEFVTRDSGGRRVEGEPSQRLSGRFGNLAVRYQLDGDEPSVDIDPIPLDEVGNPVWANLIEMLPLLKGLGVEYHSLHLRLNPEQPDYLIGRVWGDAAPLPEP